MTPLSEARRQAEEALAAYDRCKGYEAYTYAFDCVRPLRALLAALPGQNETDAAAALRVIWERLRTSHHITVRCDGRDEDGGWITEVVRRGLGKWTPGEHPLLRTPTPGQDLTQSLFPGSAPAPCDGHAAEVERLTRERDEARAVLAGFLDEPCKDCLGYEAQIGLLESHVREACAALDHFQGLASAAFRECIGREMEIAAARALHSFWREVGVDE